MREGPSIDPPAGGGGRRGSGPGLTHPELVSSSPVALAVVAGLVVGKQLGIIFFAWLAVKSGVSELPRGISWRQVREAGNITYHRRVRLKQVLREVEPQIEKLRTGRG